MTQELFDIKEEIVVFLRNQNILSTTIRGVTTQTDTGTFTGASSHTLATSPTLAKNVRSVVVGGNTLVRYTDYTVNYVTGVITFTSPQTGAYTIQYDTGTTDRIYPDYPQPDLKLSNFPRIAVEIIDVPITEEGIGGSYTRHDYLIEVVMYAIKTKDVDNYISDIQQAIMNNKAAFKKIKFITPSKIGPMLPEQGGNNKVYSRTLTAKGMFNFEIV